MRAGLISSMRERLTKVTTEMKRVVRYICKKGETMDNVVDGLQQHN